MPQPTTSSAVTNLCWVKDANGQPQMIKMLQPTQSEPVVASLPTTAVTVSTMQPIKTGTVTTSQLQARVVQGTSPQIARTFQAFQSPKTGPRTQILAISIPTSNAGKIGTTRMDPTIMPKTIQISSPMVFSTPHRVMAHPIASAPATPKQNYISPILDHSGARKRQESDCDFALESKRRKAEKVGKGLRHFSMKVCEKVQRKGTTSYNEVADELVAEFTSSTAPISTADQQYDQKNIRRRVYDALNVLMAMNIISKEKKEIKWLGLPANSLQECQNLEKEKVKRLERIRQKNQQLHELILQQIAFKNLVERNQKQEQNAVPAANTSIQLPFIVVNTNKKTVIDCSISKDKMEYLFKFDHTFEIHDDIEVLKRMGMAMGLEKGQCSENDIEKAKTMIPRSLDKYIGQLASGDWESRLPIKLEESSSISGEDMEVQQASLSRDSGMASFPDHFGTEVGTPSSCEYSDNDSDYSEDVEVN